MQQPLARDNFVCVCVSKYLEKKKLLRFLEYRKYGNNNISSVEQFEFKHSNEMDGGIGYTSCPETDCDDDAN